MYKEVQRYRISQGVRLTDSGIVVQHIKLAIRKTGNLGLECSNAFLRSYIKSEDFDASCREVAECLERSRSCKHSATLRCELQGQRVPGSAFSASVQDVSEYI